MRRTASFDVLSVKIHAGVSAVGDWKNQEKVVKGSVANIGVYISRIWGEETPKPIWIKFGIVVDVPDVITYTNFGDHR